MEDKVLKDVPTGAFVFLAIVASMPWLFLIITMACLIICD
jgi:hypothetical protein